MKLWWALAHGIRILSMRVTQKLTLSLTKNETVSSFLEMLVKIKSNLGTIKSILVYEDTQVTWF